MEFPLLPADCRNRQSPALLQEIDFSTPTFHCFLGIGKEEENSTSVTREERPRDKVQHSCMNTKAPSAAAKKQGTADDTSAWSPPNNLIPWHKPAQGCICLRPKSEQWPQLKLLHFCPYHSLMFKPWFFQPLSLSDGFGNCASCHSSVLWQVWSNSTLISNVTRLSNEISTLRVWKLNISAGNQKVPSLTPFPVLSPERSGRFFQASYSYTD